MKLAIVSHRFYSKVCFMPSQSENLKGMFYMTLSMASFCLADLALKWACEILPTGQVMFILGLGCCALFWGIVKGKQEKALTRQFFIPAVLLRTVGEAVAVVFIFLALITLPSPQSLLFYKPYPY